MKRIKLSDGGFTIVDKSEYQYLKKWKWRKNSQGYVRRSLGNGEFLHRLLINAPNNMLVDHINRNPLDNRKQNLRIVTPSRNNVNQKLKSNNKSGFRGINWHKAGKKWAVEIKFEGKRYFIGLFADIEEAIGARLTAELIYFGEFCNA